MCIRDSLTEVGEGGPDSDRRRMNQRQLLTLLIPGPVGADLDSINGEALERPPPLEVLEPLADTLHGVADLCLHLCGLGAVERDRRVDGRSLRSHSGVRCPTHFDRDVGHALQCDVRGFSGCY